MNIYEQIAKIRKWRIAIARNNGRRCSCAWCVAACAEVDRLETELLKFCDARDASIS